MVTQRHGINMANKYVLVATLKSGVNKLPGTLGKHYLEFDSDQMMVRGIRSVAPHFEELHFDGHVPLDVEVHQGKCGYWTSDVKEVTPWQHVESEDVLRYNCGKIIVLKGKYAQIRKDILLGKEGAYNALHKWRVEKAARKSGNYQLYKKLVNHASLKYSLPTLEWVNSLPEERDNLCNPSDYRGYRSSTQGYEILHTTICGYEIAYMSTYGVDPYNNALGSIRTSMHYYVKKA